LLPPGALITVQPRALLGSLTKTNILNILTDKMPYGSNNKQQHDDDHQHQKL
jgi:hypothetical protein